MPAKESSCSDYWIRCPGPWWWLLCQLPYAQAPGIGRYATSYHHCIWYRLLIIKKSFGDGLHLWSDFIDYPVTQIFRKRWSSNLGSDSSSLCYFSGDQGFSWLYVARLRMQDFNSRLTLIPIQWSEKEQIKADTTDLSKCICCSWIGWF